MFKKQNFFNLNPFWVSANGKSTRNLPVHVIVLIVMLISVLGSPIYENPVRAASIVVNTDQEIEADNSLCSLYEAVIAANTDTAYKGCPAGSGTDVITFAGDYTITLLVTELQILSPLTITGNGITNTIIQASDCNPITLPGGCSPAYNRVISVTNTDVTINNLTIRYGNCVGLCAGVLNIGGGVYNAGGNLTLNNVLIDSNKSHYGGGLYGSGLGTTTINNVTFTGNDASIGDGWGGGAYISANTTFTDVIITNNTAKYGGGIYFNYGYTYNMLRARLANNSASMAGGGIYNDSSNPYITNSTISGNDANYMLGGGGMYNNGSNPILTNVTISGNSAENSYGGGMFNNNSDPVLTNVTFSNNLAGSNGGGGMLNSNGSNPTLYNTLIANSPLGGDCVNNSTTLSPSNNNLIEDSSNACGLTNGANGNIVGQDPLLGALLDNGGATLTHALQTGSPAIDAGTNTGCPTDDQRGVIRPQGSNCDIGAYEYEPTTFTDVPTNHWAWQYVETLYISGITGGCGAGNYCPDNQVTRAQMAVFLLRGIHGSSYTPPAATGTVFNDVGTGDFAAAWIEQMVSEGITSGCGGGNYCPNATVTRAQMAVFLLRAKYGSAYTPPAATGTVFTDVPSNGFAAAWIEQLVSEGVTSGCGGGNYCPNAPVTRAQMAVFLVRIFNLP